MSIITAQHTTLLLLCAFLCTKMPFSGKLHTGLDKLRENRHIKDVETQSSESPGHTVPRSLSVIPQLGGGFTKFKKAVKNNNHLDCKEVKSRETS